MREGKNWNTSYTAYVDHMVCSFPSATAGERGKIIWPLPKAGNIPKSRYGQRSGNSCPMCTGTSIIWKAISARAMRRIPEISLLS